MKVDFRRLTWENYPSTETPINADNLNRLEEGVAGLYSDLRDIEQELEGGVGEYVSDWLSEHVDPVGSAVVVDDTLSIEGAAADAKKTGDELSSLKEDITSILDSAYVTDTASGSIASFPDGADGVPVKSLTVNVEPVQSGSGDPSPDNVRPISGHTQAVMTRTGKNLFDSSLLSDVASSIKYVTVNLKPNTQYTMSSTIPIQGGNTANLFFMLPSESASSGTNGINVNRPVTLTTGSDGIAKVGYRLGDNTVSQYLAYNFQIEVGSTATEYNAYSQPQTVTIDLDGTRYGGTLDVTTGVLTVDMVKIIADGTNIKTTGGYGAYGALWLPAIILSDTGINATTVDNLKASYLKTSPSTQTVENTIGIGGGGQLIVLHIGTMQGTDGTHGYNSANEVHAAVNAYLQSNNLEICYRLATPTTVQLTAQEVSTLLGQNNIWADCGDTTVEYRADTKLYIEKLTAPTEDDMVADHAISANSFFMVGNTLYRATTAIASGATITVGTNATKLSLSDALNALA